MASIGSSGVVFPWGDDAGLMELLVWVGYAKKAGEISGKDLLHTKKMVCGVGQWLVLKFESHMVSKECFNSNSDGSILWRNKIEIIR